MLAPEIPPPYYPGEVADLFRVDVKTIARWARAGKLPYFRTLGGHRRFPRAAINALMTGVADAVRDADAAALAAHEAGTCQESDWSCSHCEDAK